MHAHVPRNQPVTGNGFSEPFRDASSASGLRRGRRRLGALGVCVFSLVLFSCKREPEPTPERTTDESQAAVETKRLDKNKSGSKPAEKGADSEKQQGSDEAFTPSRTRPRKVHARPVASVPVSPGDPLKGSFSLKQATTGLKGEGKLVAEIVTQKGTMSCELFEDKAPITVATFVGLARGLRPFKNPEGKWVTKPAYDGTTFHRIIKGFMIQGGDPAGTGAGQPGFVIPDEIWEDAYHDERGLLCMANRGPNTNGMQFFILDAPAPHLDNGYTIFGKCGPDKVIEALANVPTRGDRAIDPPKIEHIKIRRGS